MTNTPASASPGDAALTTEQARTIAIHAAGMPYSLGSAAQVLKHLGSVQLDAIGVLAKAHQLTIASRLRERSSVAAVDDELWHNGRVIAFEYPAHAAALVAVEDWPLWAFRRRVSRTRKEYPERRIRNALLARISDAGALTLRELRDGDDAGHGGWDWSPTKTAVQFLVWSGELACVKRDESNNRLFDLASRTIPANYFIDVLTDDECRFGSSTELAEPSESQPSTTSQTTFESATRLSARYCRTQTSCRSRSKDGRNRLGQANPHSNALTAPSTTWPSSAPSTT